MPRVSGRVVAICCSRSAAGAVSDHSAPPCRAALGQLVDDFVAGRLPVDRTSELARTGAVVTLLATAAAATALAVASVIAGRGKR